MKCLQGQERGRDNNTQQLWTEPQIPAARDGEGQTDTCQQPSQLRATCTSRDLLVAKPTGFWRPHHTSLSKPSLYGRTLLMHKAGMAAKSHAELHRGLLCAERAEGHARTRDV